MRADIVIYNLLKDSSNIFPFVIPQSTAITDGNVYMTYSVVETDSVTTKSSFNDYDRTTVQLSFFSSSLDAAMVKADAVRLLIDRYSAILTVATVEYDVDLISFVSQDFVGYDEDNEVYMIAADYQISLAPVYLFQQVVPCGSSLAANLGKTIRVGNFPLLWLTGGSGGYYDVYKGDTFLIAGTGCIWGGGVSDYAAVTNIDLRNKSLTTDFNFLDKFNNLTHLDFGINQLTILDVSQLINLTNLICGNNSLTILDVSQLINLTDLFCSNNQITILDVSQLINLTILNCGYNQLTILDVSQLTNLNSLYSNNNQLTILDVSQLINLTVLQCDINQLTTLNVSQLVNLSYLQCNNNQITVLDTSQLTNLNRLQCNNNQLTTLNVSQLVNLTSLICSANQITALDVSQLINLTSLVCSNNQLAILDVSQLVNLSYLQCSINQLAILDISQLTNLNRLYCNNNQLTAAANSQILIDLDTHNLSNGFFRSSIFGGGTLTTAGLAAKAALLLKGWTIVGL